MAAPVETQDRASVPYVVPEIREFWKDDDALQEIGQSLIQKWPRQFGHIGAEEVWWGWRKNGGREGRKDRKGGVIFVTATSPLMHFARKGLMVYLSADHVKALNPDERTIEALLFHYMMTIGKNAKGLPIKRAPDFAGFRAELEQYGHWSADLQRIANVQLGLGFRDAEDDPQQPPTTSEPEGPATNGRARSRNGRSPEEVAPE